MNNPRSFSTIVNMTSRFFVALAVAMSFSLLHADEISIDNLNARIAGVYTLEQWHKDGKIFSSPQVEGQFILRNGLVTTILHDRMELPSQKTTILHGKYRVESNKFFYGYDDTSIYTETPSGVSVSHKPFWEGMREFAISSEAGEIYFRSENPKREWVFNGDGLTFSENDKLIRVWRRIPEK